jgi:menaquinol-cytochrome c reductase iron-sulfur subunit
MDEDPQLSRRRFLGIATWSIAGFVGIAMIVPAVAYIIGPALKRNEKQNWVKLGPASKVELNTPTLFKVTVENQTGWITTEEELSFYVLSENGRDYIAMSNICTHLGCRVRWIDNQQQFFCPCHNGVFDKEGAVVSGPPPRSLEHYQVKLEDDQLFLFVGG